MKEKILLKLKQNKGNTSVSDRTLEEQAQVMAAIITTDEQLESFDASAYVTTLGGNISKDVSDAVKSLSDKKTQEEKDAAAKKAADEAEEKAKANQKNDETPAWAKTLLETVEKQNETISELKGEKITTNRKDLLVKSLEKVPGYISKPILNAFEKTNFTSDEDFNDFHKNVETQRDEFIQVAAEQNLNISVPGSDSRKPDPEEVSKEMLATIKEITTVPDESEKPF